MSTINSKNVQVGTSGIAAQNFTLYQPATPDGTVRLGVGNSGATTGDVVTVNSAGVTVTGSMAASAVTSTTTPIPVSSGGTGASTLTANNVILGNGTSAVGFVAPGSNGNILTSNGTTWTSAAAASSYAGPSSQLFTSNGTFTVPAGITSVIITVVGGGGGGGGCVGSACGETSGGVGGFGGSSIAYVTGLTPGGTISITVGAAGTAGGSGGGTGGTGGTSSAASYASATGGTGGRYNQSGGQATPGVGSLGRFNGRYPASSNDLSTIWGYVIRTISNGNGAAGVGYGAGGSGGFSNNNGNKSGGVGAGGMVQVEW